MAMCPLRTRGSPVQVGVGAIFISEGACELKSKEEYNAYMREYRRKRHKAERDKAIIRLGGKCVECGSTESLEFDHIDRNSKNFEIGVMFSQSKAKVEVELAKCQLLCRVHHEEKTLRESGLQPWRHGTITGYKTKRCRCRLCKDACAEHSRIYRKTHPRRKNSK